MSHVPYVALGNHLIDLGFTFVATFISIKIIFQNQLRLKSSKISPTITVFYFYVFIRSVWSLINFVYLLGWFRWDIVIYDARILYILGMFPGIFVTTNSLMELFLCCDRCLYIIFPIQYSSKQRSVFALITVVGLFACTIYVIHFGDLVQTIPKTSVTKCYYFSCLINDGFIIKVKLLLLIANIFGGFILATLMKYFLKTDSESTKKLNKTVLIIIVATTIIELVPFFMAFLFFWITRLQFAAYTGPGGITVASINITLSAAIYSRAFSKSTNGIGNTF